MRLIDADALKETIDREIFRHDTIDHVFQIIDDAPTIEPKRGEWIETERDIGEVYPERVFICSHCNSLHYIKYSFCPSCGADMREREGE